MKALLLVTVVLLTAFDANAQLEVKHEPQFWHLALAQGRMHERWLYFLEAQPRVGGTNAVTVLRSAVGYQPTEHLSLWLGAAWIPLYDFASDTLNLNEGRFFQQSLYARDLGPVRFTNRTRLEQRRLASTPSLSHRARTLFRGALPLDDEKAWSAIAWDEVFFHLNSVEGGPRSGFDQNRAFAGVGFKASKYLTLEFGYLNTFIRQPSATNDRMIHALYTFSILNFM